MNTFHCAECNEPIADTAHYCPVCGIAKTLLQQRSDEQELAIRRSATWHKEVAPLPNRANPLPLPPRPARSRPPMWNTWRRICYRIPPTLIVWISLLIFLISGSIFGIVVTRGSGISKHANELALQATPDNVVIGATVILNGEHFNPYGKIGLTRDASIPLQDTANATIITADSSGNFTDTIVVTPDWDTGVHAINAEDAFRHKVASFSIIVAGHTTSLRPAHLRVSVHRLDMGTGDQSTNTTRIMTLTNIGGGFISWQGNSMQSWLMLSPTSGTFASGHSAQIMVAVDRSKLNPGSYNAQIHIFSTAGNSAVPVKASITALVQGHGPVLQINPSLLSFTATDGGPSPSSQTITVSNPATHLLKWQAATDMGWLFVSPQSAIINPKSGLPITINVKSSLLLPGTYNGTITLSTQEAGSAVRNPQKVFVTVTIMPLTVTLSRVPVSPVVQPACAFTTSQRTLNLTGISKQAEPINYQMALLTSLSCTNKLSWTATTSGGNWLSATVGGTTLNVSTTLAHLNAKDYSGTITITAQDSVTGLLIGAPQVIPVALTVQPACTLQSPSSSVEAFDTTTESKPTSQTFTISIMGTCNGPVTITPSIVSNTGASWLTATTNTTTITSGESTTVTVTITSAKLPVGKYEATIRLNVSNDGVAIANSPQAVDVKLNVEVPPSTKGTPTPTPSSTPVATGTPTTSPSPTLITTRTPTPTSSSTSVVTTTPTPGPSPTSVVTTTA